MPYVYFYLPILGPEPMKGNPRVEIMELNDLINLVNLVLFLSMARDICHGASRARGFNFKYCL